ncbi:MAG TPA: CPBP family intramembrane glutamic endopeptidase [Tepidisphaeraceae bacterium]|nr:CPBP family intramembrane glutamic endopeptidase [Tepidisphaeraceae bacterium]
MSRAATARPAKSSRPSVIQNSQSALVNYLKKSERPLVSLVFLLPLIAVHEIGWRISGSHLLAFQMLREFCDELGATGPFIPALVLIVSLLGWHLARHDKWTVEVNTLLGMALESLLLAIPLLALAAGMARWTWRPILAGFLGPGPSQLVIALGAGIYEEMIFRLILITLLNILLVDMLKIPKIRAAILMVVISAVAFSFYHYLGAERFSWRTCLFRTAAGIYFGAIFICRGFGVTAGCHAIYDCIACCILPVA